MYHACTLGDGIGPKLLIHESMHCAMILLGDSFPASQKHTASLHGRGDELDLIGFEDVCFAGLGIGRNILG